MLIAVVVWRAIGSGVVDQVSEKLEEAAGMVGEPSTWPPPPGMARDRMFADQPGEQVVPATADNQFHPLRRRYVDPWITISNPRIENGPLNSRVLTVDYEIIDVPGGSNGDVIGVLAYMKPPGRFETAQAQAVRRKNGRGPPPRRGSAGAP